MPSRSYTEPLWNIVIASAGTTAGPFVPAGYLWVVRDVTLAPPGNPSPNHVGPGFLKEAQSGTVLWGVGATDVVGTSLYHSELRQALVEGNQLEFYCATAGWSVAVTGYSFTSS